MDDEPSILKKIFKHVFRWWGEDEYVPHPLLRMCPPFLIEVFGVVLVLAILYGIGKLLIETITGL